MPQLEVTKPTCTSANSVMAMKSKFGSIWDSFHSAKAVKLSVPIPMIFLALAASTTISILSQVRTTRKLMLSVSPATRATTKPHCRSDYELLTNN